LRVVIIGGTGHIGRFLTRMLVDDGQQVVVVSSGRTPADTEHTSAGGVEFAHLRYPGTLADGTFKSLLREKRPDAVVDILQSDTKRAYSRCLEEGVRHLVLCGSVWMFGRPKVVPTPEATQTECPFEAYRLRYVDMLRAVERSENGGLAVTGVMPPNICGPGKIPLDGMGGRSIEAHRAHRRGGNVILPFPGTNLIGPCDAEDVAQGFFRAIKNREAAAGHILNVGSSYALTAERFIKTYADIYGTRIPIEYVSAESYVRDVSPDLGSYYHFLEHMCPDISRISSLLGYRPRYTPEETMERAVKWMLDTGMLTDRA